MTGVSPYRDTLNIIDDYVMSCPLEDRVEISDQHVLAFQLPEKPFEAIVKLYVDERLILFPVSHFLCQDGDI